MGGRTFPSDADRRTTVAGVGRGPTPGRHGSALRSTMPPSLDERPVPVRHPGSPVSVTRLKRMVPLAAIVASSLVLAACASTSPSTTVDTHPHGVPYLTQSGSGDRTITSVPLPATWSLVWKFSCTDPTTRRSFVLAVSSGRPTADNRHRPDRPGGRRLPPVHRGGGLHLHRDDLVRLGPPGRNGRHGGLPGVTPHLVT